MELLILIVIGIFIIVTRLNNGEDPYKFFSNNVSKVYNKYAPYSYTSVQEKTKSLGREYTLKDYVSQITMFAGVAGGIGFAYFHSLIIASLYAIMAVSFIPYLAYLRTKRIYSEFLFEQVQIYTTNVIMEFNTTQSFVKSLEGVRDSGILEDPVASDVSEMIDLSYKNGTIDESVAYFNEKYPYYMVKNMNQLFLQITKEGARDSGQALENMAMDIDALVEGVYRDQLDRKQFHGRFIKFGLVLYVLVIVMQYMLGMDSYLELIQSWYVELILHTICFVNAYFLLSGEKYYNENVGAE
ncbi:MAG: hypothetical protein R3Y13_04160 [bacterium]